MGESSAAKRAKVSAASGAAIAMHALLGIPELRPECPAMPDEFLIMTGTAPTPFEYIPGLVANVNHRLSVYLYEHKDIQLKVPLFTLQTPEIGAAAGGAAGAPTAFKERWNMHRCVHSLELNGIYEAALTVYQFCTNTNTWNDQELGAELVTWPQLDACVGFWTKAALTASAEKDKTRRLFFPGMLPTCIKSVWEVTELIKKTLFFQKLPACGGQAILWSWYVAMDAALRAGDELIILALHQAALNVTSRMRLNPSKDQVALDQMAFVDTLRMKQVAAGATSSFEFAVQVCRLTKTVETDTGPVVEKKLKTLGIQFGGKDVSRTMRYTITAVASIVKKEDCLKAVRFVERSNPNVLANPDKIQRIIACIKKNTNVNETDHVLVFLMEVIGVSLLCGDAGDDTYSVEKLVGAKKGDPAFVQLCLTKFRFLAWFLNAQMNHAASGATAALSMEGLEKIKSKVASVLAFFREFAKMEKKSEVQDMFMECGAFQFDLCSLPTHNIPPALWRLVGVSTARSNPGFAYPHSSLRCNTQFRLSQFISRSGSTLLKVQFSFQDVVSTIAIHMMKTQLHLAWVRPTSEKGW